ncbi:hypothetical protein N8I77_000123 [Diaporthe amygdali]|uniref:Uncharacterized protein n=1 Tax=Phomopsis amygdali TaxID=1214568 RepID=A0AAD9SN71_PHOAM|nr:hypothetical protein N8I77_000123 [Diaporthe amygdali]
MANIHHAGSLSGHHGTSTTIICTCKFPKPYMSNDNYDDINGNGEISKILLTENLQMDNGAMYTRRHVCEPATNPNPWKDVAKIARPKTPPKNKSLWVVRQRQDGKNPHWSLFAAFNDDTDGPPGRVWQVNGDPDVGMHYAHGSPDQGIHIFLSAYFADKLLVCDNLSQDWETKLDEIAHTIKPPGPPKTPELKVLDRLTSTAVPARLGCGRFWTSSWRRALFLALLLLKPGTSSL